MLRFLLFFQCKHGKQRNRVCFCLKSCLIMRVATKLFGTHSKGVVLRLDWTFRCATRPKCSWLSVRNILGFWTLLLVALNQPSDQRVTLIRWPRQIRDDHLHAGNSVPTFHPPPAKTNHLFWLFAVGVLSRISMRVPLPLIPSPPVSVSVTCKCF